MDQEKEPYRNPSEILWEKAGKIFFGPCEKNPEAAWERLWDYMEKLRYSGERW